MLKRQSERTPKPRVVQLGGRQIIAEGLSLNFWADISHRCLTASWPSFIAGAALVFLMFNAVFAVFYWIGDQPISNVPGGAYIDYLYFSIETLSTAGYGDMHPQTHYGHFIAAIELFTGIFSTSLMAGLIFARFSRPSAPLLFANNPVIPDHEGEQEGGTRPRKAGEDQSGHQRHREDAREELDGRDEMAVMGLRMHVAIAG